MLPTDVKTMEEHRLRWAKALEPIFDVESLCLGLTARPGELPVHVFDFQDGMRMIVSRERDTTGEIIDHLSASFRAESRLYHRMRNGKLTRDDFCDMIEDRVRDLSNGGHLLNLVGYSEKGVPHFIIESSSVPVKE